MTIIDLLFFLNGLDSRAIRNKGTPFLIARLFLLTYLERIEKTNNHKQFESYFAKKRY